MWNVLSPDACLNPYKLDYKWLSKVYDAIRPIDERGKLIWAALGPKTLELIHENVSVENVVKDEDILELDSEIIQNTLPRTSSLICPLITYSFSVTIFSEMVPRLLSNVCVATPFYQLPAHHVFLFLRN